MSKQFPKIGQFEYWYPGGDKDKSSKTVVCNDLKKNLVGVRNNWHKKSEPIIYIDLDIFKRDYVHHNQIPKIDQLRWDLKEVRQMVKKAREKIEKKWDEKIEISIIIKKKEDDIKKEFDPQLLKKAKSELERMHNKMKKRDEKIRHLERLTKEIEETWCVNLVYKIKKLEECN